MDASSAFSAFGVDRNVDPLSPGRYLALRQLEATKSRKHRAMQPAATSDTGVIMAVEREENGFHANMRYVKRRCCYQRIFPSVSYVFAQL